MASDRQRNALQVIFSFFLGLMVVAFIGVGVNTFYPEPYEEYYDQTEELYRQQEDIQYGPNDELTAAEEAELEEVRKELRALEDERQDYTEDWTRNTSIILIVFATAVMGISLVRSEQLRIISNGLLLGGLFTMVYGVGWVISSGTSVARFGVMTFALLVTFVLGYLRFVRERGGQMHVARLAPAGAGTVASDGTVVVPDQALAELTERIARLEKRTADAAAVLGSSDDEE